MEVWSSEMTQEKKLAWMNKYCFFIERSLSLQYALYNSYFLKDFHSAHITAYTTMMKVQD